MPEKPRVGLLTGTFDPVHLGHVALAEAAVKAFALERVWVWVNADAAHKVGVTPYAHRLAMAKLATENSDRVGVYDGGLSAAPHTISTFTKLADHNPSKELCYIVGADTISRIDRWDEIESVVKCTTFLLADRGDRKARMVVDELRQRLGALGDLLTVECFEFDGHNDASSFMVRAGLRAGEVLEDLDEKVYKYILAHGLYR